MNKTLLIGLIFLLSSCNSLFKWQTEYPDNFAEEAIEDFIEDKTGYDIDLTPISGEETQMNLKEK